MSPDPSARRAPSGDAAWLTFPATFYPSARTLTGATIIHTTAGHDRSGLDVVVPLTKTYQVAGTITGADGPAALLAVHLLLADSVDNPLFDISTAVTDGKGAFTFYGVPPGQYVARIVRTPSPAGDARFGVGGGGGDSPLSVFITGRGPGTGPPQLSDEPLLYADQAITVVDRPVNGLNIALRQGAHVRGHVEFQGAATPPTAAQLQQILVRLDPANGDTYNAFPPNPVSADGHFATPSFWPSRYVVRIGFMGNSPPGWYFKSATYQGRNVSESPLALSSDIDDLTITFTDHPSKVEGTVVGDDGKADAGAVVILFPREPGAWVDYGRSTSGLRNQPAIDGAFTIVNVPEGDYLLIAISDADAADWQNPAILQKLSILAERVHVGDGQATTVSLRTKHPS